MASAAGGEVVAAGLGGGEVEVAESEVRTLGADGEAGKARVGDAEAMGEFDGCVVVVAVPQADAIAAATSRSWVHWAMRILRDATWWVADGQGVWLAARSACEESGLTRLSLAPRPRRVVPRGHDR